MTQTLKDDFTCLDLSLPKCGMPSVEKVIFRLRKHALNKCGISPVCIITALCILAYMKTFDEVDELCVVSASFARVSFHGFVWKYFFVLVMNIFVLRRSRPRKHSWSSCVARMFGLCLQQGLSALKVEKSSVKMGGKTQRKGEKPKFVLKALPHAKL